MCAAGFVYGTAFGVSFFLDGPHANPRDAVQMVFSGEKVKAREAFPAPDVSEVERAEQFKVVSLEGLVRMKLTAFHDKDRVHLRDMLGVGLIDSSWPPRLPSPLAERLQQLIDNPE